MCAAASATAYGRSAAGAEVSVRGHGARYDDGVSPNALEPRLAPTEPPLLLEDEAAGADAAEPGATGGRDLARLGLGPCKGGSCKADAAPCSAATTTVDFLLDEAAEVGISEASGGR